MLQPSQARSRLAIMGDMVFCAGALLAMGGCVFADTGVSAAVAGAPSPAAVARPAANAQFASSLGLACKAVRGARSSQVPLAGHDPAADKLRGDGNRSAVSQLAESPAAERSGRSADWPAVRFLAEACSDRPAPTNKNAGSSDAYLIAIPAFSDDGDTLAVGTPEDSSAARGIGGDPAASPGAANSGAVHVFVRRSSGWQHEAFIKASNTSAGDAFGAALSLSRNGNTLAVGAYLEDSPGTGVNGNQGHIADNNSNAGAAYVFVRRRGLWSQQAYVKASNTHGNAYFGQTVALDADGNTVAIGATGESSGGLNSGAVYVFARCGGDWSQQAFLKAAAIRSNAYFGSSIYFSGDTLLVGANLPSEAGRSARPGGSGAPDDVASVQRVTSFQSFSRSTNEWFATALSAGLSKPALTDANRCHPSDVHWQAASQQSK